MSKKRDNCVQGFHLCACPIYKPNRFLSSIFLATVNKRGTKISSVSGPLTKIISTKFCFYKLFNCEIIYYFMMIRINFLDQQVTKWRLKQKFILHVIKGAFKIIIIKIQEHKCILRLREHVKKTCILSGRVR